MKRKTLINPRTGRNRDTTEQRIDEANWRDSKMVT